MPKAVIFRWNSVNLSINVILFICNFKKKDTNYKISNFSQGYCSQYQYRTYTLECMLFILSSQEYILYYTFKTFLLYNYPSIFPSIHFPIYFILKRILEPIPTLSIRKQHSVNKHAAQVHCLSQSADRASKRRTGILKCESFWENWNVAHNSNRFSRSDAQPKAGSISCPLFVESTVVGLHRASQWYAKFIYVEKKVMIGIITRHLGMVALWVLINLLDRNTFQCLNVCTYKELNQYFC